jgi:hypothetical protein
MVPKERETLQQRAVPRLNAAMAPSALALLPAFSLRDDTGADRSFPSGRAALICFVKEDCPTCNVVMPVLDSLERAFGDDVDVLVAGQTQIGNKLLKQRYRLGWPLLDDSSLKASFAYDIEVVPTLILASADGRAIRRIEGFARDDWQNLAATVATVTGAAEPPIDWQSLPEWRPGCGSRSVDPLVAERLRAEAENSPLRARRIEIAPADDESEFMFDQGFSDGLPVVAPTPERVMRMLAGTRRDPQDIVAVVPPNLAPATVEKVAINAVMAGCKPEYLPVVMAAIEAACNETFNMHGVMSTTMGASPVVVVNGPIRHRLGMNMQLGALGQGNRANATIGRAVRLVVRNLGGARPGGTERSTMGNPMKHTMCFAEWEERSPWDPLHVERGFKREESVVTVYAATSGPMLIVDQTSRTASQLAGSLGLGLETVHHPRAHRGTDTLLVVCPEHVDTLVRDGYTKADLRRRIQEVTAVPLRSLVVNDVSGVGLPAERAAEMSAEALDARVPKFRAEEDILIAVAGGDAGKFSAAFHGWASGPLGSMPVSRKIEEL